MAGSPGQQVTPNALGQTVTPPKNLLVAGGVNAPYIPQTTVTSAYSGNTGYTDPYSANRIAQRFGNYGVMGGVSGGMAEAMRGAATEMGYQPGVIKTPLAQMSGYTGAKISGVSPIMADRIYAPQAGAFGYGGTQISGVDPVTAERISSEQAKARGYSGSQIYGASPIYAQNVGAGQLSQTNLSPYMDPFTEQVIQANEQDILRGAQLGLNQLGAQAQAARAFGGSRQAVTEAELGRNVLQQLAQSSAGLRSQGFQQAQAAAQQDIAGRMQAALANQQAGLQAGTTTAQMDLQAQLANQAAINQARQFGAQASNVASLQNAAQALQAQQANQAAGLQAGTTTAQLGLQGQLANQAAMNQAAQFGAQAANVASLQNAANTLQALQANQATDLQASTLTNQLGLQAQLANQASANQASQFSAGAYNQAAMQNAANALAAQQANQQAGLAGSAQRLQAANQLANVSNLGFGMANTINQQLAQQGMLEQAIQQALIDAAKTQYAGFVGAPIQALNTQLGAYAGSQTGEQTQTTTKKPGLFDYLSLGASFSDARLKENVKEVGRLENGLSVYTWDWNEDGRRVASPYQPTIGVMAQEVMEVMPEAVTLGSEGFYKVNYLKVLGNES